MRYPGVDKCFEVWHKYVNGEISYEELTKELDEIKLVYFTPQVNLFKEVSRVEGH